MPTTSQRARCGLKTLDLAPLSRRHSAKTLVSNGQQKEADRADISMMAYVRETVRQRMATGHRGTN